MNLEQRIEHHRRMAKGYEQAYLKKAVHDGETYDAWQFAPEAVYSSPYFTGEEVLRLADVPMDAAKAATLEATAYALSFPDWSPADFRFWPADNGFVMKTRWEGTHNSGRTMGFYSYSFVETTDEGQVLRWETHVNEEYSEFLDVAIGARGPFHGHSEYVEALERCLAAHDAKQS
jgi:hypothetical protein